VIEDLVGTLLPIILGMLIATAVFMVYLESQRLKAHAQTQSFGEGRKKESIAEMHATTPWTSTLAAATALAVVLVMKKLAVKVSDKVGL
jgi:hypothetical protein